MPGVRPFVTGDIPAVADLVWRVLHEKTGTAPLALHAYFDELFLHNPWIEEGMQSYVYEDAQRRPIGFFGMVPRRMCLQGKPVRLAFGSNFVVDPGSRASIAAIQLVKAFINGKQDISITDSANENSRKMLRSMGFQVVPIYSLLWARPLRPTRYAWHGVARLKKSKVVATIGSIVGPLCSVADALASRLAQSPLRQTQPSTKGEELSPAALLTCLRTIPSRQLLLPDYDEDTLRWMLDFVTKRNAFGHVRRILVRDDSTKIIGWFLYYAALGQVGEVIQLGAESSSIGKVLDHLFYDAWKHGLIGLHGRMEPQFMQELTMKSCFFLRNGSWTLAHSRTPEMLAPLQGGNAYFSRMDGEWCLRPGTELS